MIMISDETLAEVPSLYVTREMFWHHQTLLQLTSTFLMKWTVMTPAVIIV